MAGKISERANLIIQTATFLLLLFSFYSCQKVSTSDTNNNPPQIIDTSKNPDLTIKVTSSVSGFVRITNVGPGEPVDGASVVFGNKSTLTDKYGYFEIKEAVVPKQAAQVIVSKNGFYTSYKTFIAEDHKSIFTRFGLEFRFSAGGGPAQQGGSFESANGVRIIIPEDALVIEGTNNHYTGRATIYATYIDPNEEDMSLHMPGDIRGFDTSGKFKMLTIYGIANLVVTGENGEQLQLAKGKVASLSLPFFGTVPNGPTTIPLWSYDEVTGLWKQNGTAANSDDHYTGLINKFGFWNFATSSNFIHFTGRLLSITGEALPFAYFDISSTAAPVGVSSILQFSDAEGYISGVIPPGSQLTLNVYGNTCADPVYSKNFSTSETDMALGDLSMQTNKIVTVSGTLTGCNGSGISDGYIMMGSGPNIYRFNTSGNGMIHFNTVVCNFNLHQSLVFIPEEISTQQTGNNYYVELVAGNNELGNLSVCGTSGVIKLTGTLVDNSGNPLKDLFVNITPSQAQLGTFRTVSDLNGKFTSFIYRNTDFLLTVYGSLQCNTPAYSINFSTTNRDTSIGNLKIANLLVAYISGHVVECNSNPATSGYIVLQKDNKNYLYPVSSTGTFYFSTPVCNATAPEAVSLIAVNNSSQQLSYPVNLSISAGNNDAGSISSCFNPASDLQFINYTIDGVSHFSYISPPDSIKQTVDPTGSYYYIVGAHVDGVMPLGITIHTPGISVGSTQLLDYLSIPQLGGGWIPPIGVTVTEYGPVGSFMAGNFTGQVQDLLPGTSTHTVSLSFRVIRRE